MKKLNISVIQLLLPTLFFLIGFNNGWTGSLYAQGVSINTTGASGSASAILDVQATDKGLLIPRVSLTSATDITTIPSPATSLLIYNTATIGAFPNNVVPGFYYFDGSTWIPLIRPTGVLAFADFYALMPPDNSATIAAGSAIAFPNSGPTSSSGITRISDTQFKLSAIGTYLVNWVASVEEAGQLVLEVNGVENLATVVGRATGSNQITGIRLITTSIADSYLRVVNPIGNSTALTMTPNAGGNRSVSASVVISRLQ